MNASIYRPWIYTLQVYSLSMKQMNPGSAFFIGISADVIRIYLLNLQYVINLKFRSFLICVLYHHFQSE